MAATGPAVVIDAPPLTPPPNGLLNSAAVIDQTEDRWINGAAYQGDTCQDVTVFDPCSTTSDITNSVGDAATTSGSPTLTSSTAKFNRNDVGLTISGSGIPASTTIQSINSSTSITLSANATATATNVTITIASRPLGSGRPAAQTVQPFGVQAYDICSTIGYEQADYEGRATRALIAHESKGVEREFWTGAVTGTVNRHLQDTSNTQQLNSGTAYGLRSGLAALVQAIADNNLGLGMIHARPSLITQWSSQNLLVRQNNKLYTVSGNLVVPGSGYTGSARDGTAPVANAEWAYVTDVLQVQRGPIEIFAGLQDGAVDRTLNEVTSRAQRMYAVTGNFCAVIGAKIDTTSTS